MKAYLIGLTAAAILAALIRRLAPNNAAGRAARLGAGLLILTALLRPLGKMDLLTAAEELAKNGLSNRLSAQQTDMAANELLKALITETAETYILDKAQTLGLKIQAEVTVNVLEYYPVPWAVTLRGEADRNQQDALQTYISEQLGIPEERQEWLDM